MNKEKFGVRIWLWIVLGIVVVIFLGYFGWMKIAGNKVSVAISPTPRKSVAITSPATGLTTSPTKTSTPSGGQTATPLVTPTSSPTSTEWKITNVSLPVAAGSSSLATFSIKVPSYINDQYTPTDQTYIEFLMRSHLILTVSIAPNSGCDVRARSVNTKDLSNKSLTVCLIQGEIGADDFQTVIDYLQQK